MSTPENDWVYDLLDDAVAAGDLTQAQAEAMSLEEMCRFLDIDYENDGPSSEEE